MHEEAPHNKIDPDALPPPWEQRPGEGKQHYDAFMAYLNLGVRRTLYAAAQALSYSPKSLAGWARKHDWKARAAAWDRHLDEAARQGALEEVAAMRRRHVSLALLMQEKVAQKLEAMAGAELDAAGAARWLSLATALEASARGVTPEVRSQKDISVTAPEGTTVTVTETVVRTRGELHAAREAAARCGRPVLEGD